jgi:phospholipid/cholesterol/gamma-HCH transport system ATP-binding protein
MTKTPPQLTIRNVQKHFESKHVLKGIDLDIHEGESLVVIGGSGTGKSVLVKCLMGLLTPDKGSQIIINGVDMLKGEKEAQKEVRQNMSMVFQGSALFDSLPVWENIAFGCLQRGLISRPDARDMAIERLRAVGLDAPVADLYPAALSGGMQRRVALARAVAQMPRILFCDEPTAGLDPIFCGVISDLIRRHVDDLQCTTVTITHDMHCARTVADRIAMLHEGHVVFLGSVQELDTTDNPYVRQFIEGRPTGPIQV